MKIRVIVDQIDLGSMALPEFQRGYVWNRDQVRGLMEALYREHPVGGLLVWLTKSEEADARGDAPLAPSVVKLLLDGQQRITSLYGIVRGKPPKFFHGNAQTFTGLHFPRTPGLARSCWVGSGQPPTGKPWPKVQMIEAAGGQIAAQNSASAGVATAPGS